MATESSRRLDPLTQYSVPCTKRHKTKGGGMGVGGWGWGWGHGRVGRRGRAGGVGGRGCGGPGMSVSNLNKLLTVLAHFLALFPLSGVGSL